MKLLDCFFVKYVLMWRDENMIGIDNVGLEELKEREIWYLNGFSDYFFLFLIYMDLIFW